MQRRPTACRFSLLLGSLLLSALTGLPARAQLVNIVNSSFEEPIVPNGTFITPPSIPGWTVSNAYGPGGYIEVQHNVAGTSLEGVQHVELDGGNRITQNVATVTGGVYDFSFGYSARPGVAAPNCAVSAFFGNSLVATLNDSGTGLTNTSWRIYTFRVTATGSSTALTFADAAPTSRDVGGYIDYVRLNTVSLPAAAPEPASLALVLLAGVPALGLVRRRIKN